MMKNRVIFLLLLALMIPCISACHAASESPLPHGMKGYELYSWQAEDQWHFTLITGTNRNKNLEEIVTAENTEYEDGWVKIHVVGVEEVEAVLSRVPENEFVFWSDGHFVIESMEYSVELMLPPDDIIEDIKEYAGQCGLDFLVAGSY
jgi:hypothetical protein